MLCYDNRRSRRLSHRVWLINCIGPISLLKGLEIRKPLKNLVIVISRILFVPKRGDRRKFRTLTEPYLVFPNFSKFISFRHPCYKDSDPCIISFWLDKVKLIKFVNSLLTYISYIFRILYPCVSSFILTSTTQLSPLFVTDQSMTSTFEKVTFHRT